MASTSLKPLLLLAARSRPLLATTTTTTTISSRPISSVLIRSFSDRFGGGEGGNTPRFRRPEGPARSGSSDGGDGAAASRRKGTDSRGRRGGGGRRRKKENYEYGGARVTTRPIVNPAGIRTHMIALSFDERVEAERKKVDTKEDGEEDQEMRELMARLHQEEQEYQAKKERWLQNSVPPVRVPVIDSVGRAYGRGARKRAHARVWITPGFGNVTVNRMDLIDYFPRFTDRELLLEPFVVTRTAAKFDAQIQVQGGGKRGQAGAVRLGVARALQHWNPLYRPVMKKCGFLTRDARKVERKKVGKVKARKSPQWNRR